MKRSFVHSIFDWLLVVSCSDTTLLEHVLIVTRLPVVFVLDFTFICIKYHLRLLSGYAPAGKDHSKTQTMQTVQTVQTEYFFSYCRFCMYFRIFFGSSHKQVFNYILK